MQQYSPRFKQSASTALLMLTACIWGMCFVAQRSSMEHMGPFLFNGIREILGAVTLALVLLVAWIITKRRASRLSSEAVGAGESEESEPSEGASTALPASLSTTFNITFKHLLLAGLFCGVALYLASNLQQVAMVTVTASKAAFITTLYIVLVPILGLFLRQKTHWNTWGSVGIAVAGLYLLCVNETLTLEPGDTILLVSALFWAIHILVVGHYAPRLNMLQLLGLCALQFAVAGLLSLATAPFVDFYFVPVTLTTQTLLIVLPELLYAGLLSTGVAFTLAAIGQRYAKPAPAAVVMSLESVFGLLGGLLLLGEALTTRESIGCVLMFAAVLLTQLEWRPPALLRRRTQKE